MESAQLSFDAVGAPALEQLDTEWVDRLIAPRLAEHAPELNIPPVRISSRMRRTLGSYHQKKLQITLGAHLLASGTPDEIEEIVLHEVAHAIAHHQHPDAKPHGNEFRRVCTALGTPPRRTVRFPVTEWVRSERIAYTCPACGAVSLRRRRQRRVRGDCGHRSDHERALLVAVRSGRPPAILGSVAVA